jgi:drug/metabolite transporter (DMT)-like permease
VIVGLINYLWPVLSLWFSLFLLGKKARFWLPVGIVLAFAGMWLASTRGEVLNVAEVFQPANLVVYGLALAAAITWGLYSNLSRKWAGAQDSGSVPLFLLASGLFLLLIRLGVSEPWAPSGSLLPELAYMVIFPTMLAYIFWDAAMRKGRMILVVTLSYFIPLLSTLISAVRLGVPLGIELWAAALMIVAGAVLCRTAIVEG